MVKCVVWYEYSRSNYTKYEIIKIKALRTSDTIRDAPDNDFAGYPANLKAGYRISGAAIRPDFQLNVQRFGKKYTKKSDIF
jgi:hypothetical protein